MTGNLIVPAKRLTSFRGPFGYRVALLGGRDKVGRRMRSGVRAANPKMYGSRRP